LNNLISGVLVFSNFEFNIFFVELQVVSDSVAGPAIGEIFYHYFGVRRRLMALLAFWDGFVLICMALDASYPAMFGPAFAKFFEDFYMTGPAKL